MPTHKWWQEEFFADLRPFFAQLSPKETNQQVRYLIKKLKLKPGMSFLDCPCGFGRVSVPMAKKGIKVVASDLTRVYLDELEATVKRTGLKIETVHSDMRKIDFRNRFDAAGNLWTSFGYFEKERDNLLVLKKVYQALKPGGRFCLHVINRDYIIAHYTATEWQEYGGVLSTERRKFDYATSINRGVWTFHKDGKARTYEVGLRMYSYHELIAMFTQAGFVDIEGFGSTEDAPITRHTLAQWVFGTKPK
ncbi:MAG: methyltransferase domain-containing protein [candidate division Zixibacteria bacterium]|nr:methyltransferase domain-containing protein [candidate division Zixibacteria bacterium]